MQILDNIKQAAIEFWQDKYKRKRTIIIAVFAAIFLSIILFAYEKMKPAPSCFDGIQNQNEEGVDCGGVCAKKCDIKAQDLVVQQSGFVPSGAVNTYDVYGQVENPNNSFGGSEFSYTFNLKDVNGKIIATKQGKGFILPAETKYVIEIGLQTTSVPASVELDIYNVKWVQFKDYFEKPQLNIVNKEYDQITSGVGFGEASGLLKNESPYDFNSISIYVILKDANNAVIALNSTSMQTVKAGEDRDFKTLWTDRFPGSVSNMEVQADVNIFNSSSFSSGYFQSGTLQSSDYR